MTGSAARTLSLAHPEETVTLTARTIPAGFEEEITWLASTKYGRCEPIMGQGPTFTVRFDETWGGSADGVPFQWLGVRADHAAFNQDRKHVVWDHVWSFENIWWGPGIWTKDGVPICTTFPCGIFTGGPWDPAHAWDTVNCPDWPNDWHWSARFYWNDLHVHLTVWFINFGDNDSLEFRIFCHPDYLQLDFNIDVANDFYTVGLPDSEPFHQASWSGYPDNLPEGFEDTGFLRNDFEMDR